MKMPFILHAAVKFVPLFPQLPVLANMSPFSTHLGQARTLLLLQFWGDTPAVLCSLRSENFILPLEL